MVVDEAKLHELLGKAVNEWGGSRRSFAHFCR